MAVFVLDKKKKPLMPCSEKRARLLLERGKARVHRMYPFTIRLTERVDGDRQPVRVKIDPGSKVTGVAVVREEGAIHHALWLGEIHHRGKHISRKLQQRAGYRLGRRNRNLRYRAPRFLNRTRAKGWLPPSLQHRVNTTMAWVHRIQRLAPVTAISQELVRFDLQKMENPEISGIEYQQGTLQGYEVREYLLEKWGRKCAYCGSEDVALQIEHIDPKTNGGSNRINNLCLSCKPCNTRKGKLDIRTFMKNKQERLQKILAQAKKPLKDAVAVNATRWTLYSSLKDTGLPVESCSGGRTKYNRTRFGIAKEHALDALCVGDVDDVTPIPFVTGIKCTGRGSYQRSRVDASGFPRGYISRQKTVEGFRTGDMVMAVVPAGKNAGIHFGRVAVRLSGYFNIQCATGVVQGISHKHCEMISRSDGYGYQNTCFLP